MSLNPGRLVLLILAITAGAILLVYINLENLAERWLATQLGREIHVDGNFSIELGLPLRLHATSLRLGNPLWVGSPDMLSIDGLELAVDPWTLRGDSRTIFEELIVTGLDATLVRDEQGRANWDFGDNSDAVSGINLAIRKIRLNNATIRLLRPDADPLYVEVDELAQDENHEGLLQTSLNGRLNNDPLAASGAIGPFQHLLQGRDIRLTLDATVGTLRVRGDGYIDDVAAPQQPALKLTVIAPDSMVLAKLLGIPDSEMEDPVDLDVEFLPAENEGVSIKAQGNLGGFKLDIQGKIAELSTLDGITLIATGTGSNLQLAGWLFGIRALPAEPFEFAGELARHGKELDIRKLRLTVGHFEFSLNGEMHEFPALNNAKLNLSVQGDDMAQFRDTFGLPGIAQGKFSVDGRIARGPAGKDEFQINTRTDLGNGRISGTLGTAPAYIGTRATVEGEGSSFQRLAQLLGLPGQRDEPFRLNAELEVLESGYQLVEGTGIEVGSSTLQIDGVLGKEPLEHGTRLQWRLEGSDIADLAWLAGLPPDLPSRPLDAAGSVQIMVPDIVLQGVTGKIGMTEFELDGEFGWDEEFRGTDLRVHVWGPELQRLDFLHDDLDLPAGQFNASARVERTTNSLRISESQLELAGARGRIDGELDLPVDNLRVQFDIDLRGPDVQAIWSDRFGLAFSALPFVVDARGELNEERWRFDDSEITIGDTQARLSGLVGRSRDDSVLQVQANSPDLSQLGVLFGRSLPPAPLDLSATVKRDGKRMEFNNFLLRSGANDLGGNLAYTPGEPARLEGSVTAGLLDLGWLTLQTEESPPAQSNEPGKANPANQPGGPQPAPEDDRAIPDWPLPLDTLDYINANVTLSVDAIHLQQRELTKVFASIKLENGALQLAPLRFGGEAGTVNLELGITPGPEGAAVALHLQASDLSTGLFRYDRTDLDFLPNGNWDLRLNGQGNNLRELVASLNGTGEVNTAGRRLSNSRTKTLLFSSFFSSVIAAVNPFAQTDDYTDLVCAVFPFTFTDGVMESAPSLVLQTDKLNVLSRGRIDLETERINLDFRTQARRGIGISTRNVINPFVRIRGTLNDPRVGLDTGAALIEGSAAFFTAGLSLIARAALESAFRSSDPCSQAMKESDKAFSRRRRNSTE